MKKLILLIFTLFIGNIYAQQVVKIFGKFTAEEINMTSYEKDKDAKGVVLYDKGKSEFIYKHSERAIRFRRHKRVKVFDKNIKDQIAVEIYYRKDKRKTSEEVSNITAITYNFIDGQQVMRKVEPTEIYDEQISNNLYKKKFVFPNVQDGSILEYKYTLEIPRYFSLPDWTFQDNIPTIYSEYEVVIVPQLEYVFLAQGVDKFDYEEVSIAKWNKIVGTNKQNDMEYRYALRDVPAFEDQSYITSIQDHIIKIDFQLAGVANLNGGVDKIISTWPKLNKTLLKHEDFGLYIKACKKYGQFIGQEVSHSLLSRQDLAKAVIDYVKQNFEWNGHYDKFASQKASKFYDSKLGSVGDINLFTIAILNQLGITAHPVILSTRDHGKILTDYPFNHFTNYVIILVEADKLFLADATENMLPYNRIPPRCINNQGLVVNKNDNAHWIELKNNVSSLEKNIITLTLNEETLDLDTKISIQSTGYESYDNRTSFENDTSTIKKYYEKRVDEIKAIRSINYNTNISTPYNIFMSGTYETEKIADKIVVKPFLDLPITENFLKHEERTYPVDIIYPFIDEYITNLQIPATHTIKSLPDNYEVSDDLVDINVSYSYENNSLTAKGNTKFKKAIYSIQEYSKLRAHVDMIVKYFNQPVIIEKEN